MLRIVLTALLAAAVLTVPAAAPAAERGPSAQALKRIMRFHNECRTWACVRRVRAARIHRAGFKMCDTWRCVRKVKRKRLARRPFYTAHASWYGPGFYGNTTACGQTFRTTSYGVAHKTLPCGTRLTICARRCAAMHVIDRGPYVAGRDFDLTRPAADAIGFGSTGPVRYRIG